MGLVERVIRWYRFERGVGKRMLERDAERMPCPYCERETPVFRSTYDSSGLPTPSNVCLWCHGLIEYSGASR